MQKRKGYGKKRECLAGEKTLEKPSALFTPWYLPQPAQFEGVADVAIVGGGIASLFTAFALMQRGANVTLYCEDPRPAMMIIELDDAPSSKAVEACQTLEVVEQAFAVPSIE